MLIPPYRHLSFSQIHQPSDESKVIMFIERIGIVELSINAVNASIESILQCNRHVELGLCSGWKGQ